jgi:hypothetical protein
VTWPDALGGVIRQLPDAAVALPDQFVELALESRHAAFELIDAIAQRRNFTFDKVPRPVADSLIDLRGGLLERFSRKPVVENQDSLLEHISIMAFRHQIGAATIVARMLRSVPVTRVAGLLIFAAESSRLGAAAIAVKTSICKGTAT